MLLWRDSRESNSLWKLPEGDGQDLLSWESTFAAPFQTVVFFFSYHLAVMEILDNVSPRKTERRQTRVPAEHLCALFKPERWRIMTWLCGHSSRFAGFCIYDYTCLSLGGRKENMHLEKTLTAQPPWLLGGRAGGAAGVRGVCPCWQRAVLYPSASARLHRECLWVKKFTFVLGVSVSIGPVALELHWHKSH